MGEPEIIIKAEPYFFSKEAIKNLSFLWLLNNKKTEPLEKLNMIGLTLSPDISGTALLELEILNRRNALQSAEKNLRINFGVEQ